MLQAGRVGDLMTVARTWGRGLRSEVGKGYAFIERGWFLTKRYWAWEIVWVTYNIVNALSVTFIAKTAQHAAPGHFTDADVNSLILYLTIGTAMWSYISAVFDSVTETVTIERWEGTIEYTFMAPVSRLTHLLGACVFALIHGLALMIVQLLAISFFFHLNLLQANWGAAIIITALGSVSLVGLGEVAAVLPLLFTERGAQMAYIIRAIMLLVSGVYYPITVLPNWLQVVAVALAGDVHARWPAREHPAGARHHVNVGRCLAAGAGGGDSGAAGAVHLRAGRALRQAHRHAEAQRLTARRCPARGKLHTRGSAIVRWIWSNSQAQPHGQRQNQPCPASCSGLLALRLALAVAPQPRDHARTAE